MSAVAPARILRNGAMAHVQALAELIPCYSRLRAEHPDIPARLVVAYLKSDGDVSFEQFCCRGHRWCYTGTAYGGDDDSYFGEGRCYCIYCGADGDA